MPHTHQQSDSLISGLCREMDTLRCRCRQLIDELARARESCLVDRLCRELASLQRRQEALQMSVRELRRGRLRDSLGLEFLAELTHRPLVS